MSSKRLRSAPTPLNYSIVDSYYDEEPHARLSTTLRPSCITSDVWREVLEHLEISDVVAFSQVCSRLRAIAFNHSSSWKNLTISSCMWKKRESIVAQSDVEELFRRSRSQPLLLTLELDDVADPALSCLLANEAKRIESLSFTYKHGRIVEQSGLLFGSSMLILRSLELRDVYVRRTDSENDVCVATMLPPGTAPSLRILTTPHHVHWDITAPRLFPRLVDLDVHIHATEDVVAVLDACPSLSTFRANIDVFLAPSATPFPSSALAAARRLQKIELCGATEMDAILNDPSPHTILTLLDLSAPRHSFKVECHLALPWGARIFEQFDGMVEYSTQVKTEGGLGYAKHTLIVTAKNSTGDIRELALSGYGTAGEDQLAVYNPFWGRMEAALEGARRSKT